MLSLRCRGREFPLAPADVAPFLDGSRTADAETDDPLLWLLSSVPSSESMGLCAEAFQGGIPAPLLAALGAPDSRPWRFSIFRPTSRAMAALALAGGLAFAPAAAAAEDDEDDSGWYVDGVLLPPSDESAEVDEDDEGVEEVEAAAPSSAEETEAVAEEKTAAPLSYEGDELWAAVRGARVEITIRAGTILTGIVLTQAGDEIAIARDPDGTVARVPKHMISRLRVLRMPNGRSASVWDRDEPDASDGRPQEGEGAAIAGAVLTITAGSMMLTSAFLTSITGSIYYGFPLMIIGSSLLGPGIPLLAWGAAQSEERRQWDREHDFSVSLGPTRGGFSGGLRFRF
jgi:hypothetical protein